MLYWEFYGWKWIDKHVCLLDSQLVYLEIRLRRSFEMKVVLFGFTENEVREIMNLGLKFETIEIFEERRK